jgi:hypothetical protein
VGAIVICELRERKLRALVILVVVVVVAKVVLNRLVLTLSLAVRLRIEGGAKAALHLQVIAEGALELASENGTLVRNDSL